MTIYIYIHTHNIPASYGHDLGDNRLAEIGFQASHLQTGRQSFHSMQLYTIARQLLSMFLTSSAFCTA